VGGHALDFYAWMELLAPAEAIPRLTGSLASGALTGKRLRLERMSVVLETVRRLACEALQHSSAGCDARAWIEGEGVTQETSEQFSLGLLSKEIRHALIPHLRAKGFDQAELEDFGTTGRLARHADKSEMSVLIPVRDVDGSYREFYQQAMYQDAEVMCTSYSLPYGFKLLSPCRVERLVLSAGTCRASSASVVLAERP
jgi:DNA primase